MLEIELAKSSSLACVVNSISRPETWHRNGAAVCVERCFFRSTDDGGEQGVTPQVSRHVRLSDNGSREYQCVVPWPAHQGQHCHDVHVLSTIVPVRLMGRCSRRSDLLRLANLRSATCRLILCIESDLDIADGFKPWSLQRTPNRGVSPEVVSTPESRGRASRNVVG